VDLINLIVMNDIKARVLFNNIFTIR